jgi:uncharacterized OB-fold protein
MTFLADLTVPGPTTTALSEPFWKAVDAGKLVIQHCKSCDQSVFYPRSLCPHCWSDALHWVTATGQGVLKSYSRVWKPGHPGWIPAAPYFVGLVEMAEGPTMLSHILTEKETISVGDPLRFAPTNIGGRILPCFNLDLSKNNNEEK